MALTYKVLNSNFEKMNGKSLAGSETFGGGKVGQNIISVVFDIKYKELSYEIQNFVFFVNYYKYGNYSAPLWA